MEIVKTSGPGKKYQKLVESFPLIAIKKEAQYKNAIKIAKALHLKEKLDSDEELYLEALGIFIKLYEDLTYPNDYLQETPLEALHSLMACDGLKQIDLARILGETSGRASEIYNGKREMSKSQIKILSEYFQVQANVFLGLTPTAVSLTPSFVVNESTSRYKQLSKKRREEAK